MYLSWQGYQWVKNGVPQIFFNRHSLSLSHTHYVLLSFEGNRVIKSCQLDLERGRKSISMTQIPLSCETENDLHYLFPFEIAGQLILFNGTVKVKVKQPFICMTKGQIFVTTFIDRVPHFLS